ncbi:MAG: glycogen synthase [Fusobacteriaceae bacterium]|jgi:starch synthase|nr:glycogen synthase [Fusobacteriaceae bacterium]
MKVLFVAGEALPFVKTGGLGDVAFSLPKSLKEKGVDCRVMMPKYSQIAEKYRFAMTHLGEKRIWMEHHWEYVGVDMYEYEGVVYYFIDGERYFNRSKIYGELDDCERFTFFCKAVSETFDLTGFIPDIIHCNDWHTGLVPIYLKERHVFGVKTVFTIHNLRFQGLFYNDVIERVLEIPRWAYYYDDGVKYYDMVSFLKGGVVYSDLVTTVSKTYAKEIRTPEFGEGLHGLFDRFGYKLHGVVNGIDYGTYKSPRSGKTRLKTQLQEKIGLKEDPYAPLLAMVTRLDRQKGVDLVMRIFDRILETGAQFVLLGNGEPWYEDFFRWKERQYPGRVCSYIGFNQELSKDIYGGADIFLMPSIFEPCGLSQMIAMRYGTIPVVRETGGLCDTVTPYNQYTGEGDGFGFKNVNEEELLWCVRFAINLYFDNDKWFEIIKHAKARDNSWDKPADEYIGLYKMLA